MCVRGYAVRKTLFILTAALWTVLMKRYAVDAKPTGRLLGSGTYMYGRVKELSSIGEILAGNHKSSANIDKQIIWRT